MARRRARFLRRQKVRRRLPDPSSLPVNASTPDPPPTPPQQHRSHPPHVRQSTSQTTTLPLDLSPPPSTHPHRASQPHRALAQTPASYTTTPMQRSKPAFDATRTFSSVTQVDDALLHISAIHVSVRDGARDSRVAPRIHRPFAHNEVRALHAAFRPLREGRGSVFVAIESVSNMYGIVSPPRAMVDAGLPCRREPSFGYRRGSWGGFT